MKKENNKMTIEKLAVMVAGGFEHIDKKFELVDKRFDHLENRMDGLELKISSAASSWSHEFERLHDWVSDLDERMNRVEDKVAGK